MPHIIIKLWPGKTSEEKSNLVKKFKEDMNETMGIPKSVITVAFDEVKPEDWYDEVHVPLIDGNKTGKMYIPEGYKAYKKQ